MQRSITHTLLRVFDFTVNFLLHLIPNFDRQDKKHNGDASIASRNGL